MCVRASCTTPSYARMPAFGLTARKRNAGLSLTIPRYAATVLPHSIPMSRSGNDRILAFKPHRSLSQRRAVQSGQRKHRVLRSPADGRTDIAPTRARHRVTGVVLQHPLRLAAGRLGVLTSARKDAAGRQARCARWLALKSCRAGGARIEPRRRIEKSPGVGVPRCCEELVRPGHLYNTPEIH